MLSVKRDTKQQDFKIFDLHLSDLNNFHSLEVVNRVSDSPGALDLYPDKIHNKLIFSEKIPRGTYITILKVPENPPGAFQEIQDGVQDGRRRTVISRKLCKAVNFSSIFFCNIPFQLVLWSVSPSSLLPDNIDEHLTLV